MATRAFKLCIDSAALTGEQAKLLDRHAGTARAVFNWALAIRNEAHDRRWWYLKNQAEAACPDDVEARQRLLRDEKWRKHQLALANDPGLMISAMAELSRRFTAMWACAT